MTIAIVLAACGPKPPPPELQAPPPQPIRVEWKVERGEGTQVNVSLVVDGKAIAIGPLEAVTEMQVGTATCALRAAGPRRTEIVCGDSNAYSAALGDGELVVSLVPAIGAPPAVVKRIPVYGDALAIQMLALPIDP